jgi:hypothetical protein
MIGEQTPESFMIGPSVKPVRDFDLGLDDLTQEIDAPLEGIPTRDEPTLTKIDFDELEISLDL